MAPTRKGFPRPKSRMLRIIPSSRSTISTQTFAPLLKNESSPSPSGDRNPKSARHALWAITFDANGGRKGLRDPPQCGFATKGSKKNQQRPR